MLRESILALAFTLSCASCEPPPSDPATRATLPAPEPEQAAPATVAIGATRYTCDDGSALGVRYVADRAQVELPDGRTVTLPKAQSASKGGGEAFVGEALALQRDGDDIQLHRDEQPALHCRSTGT